MNLKLLPFHNLLTMDFPFTLTCSNEIPPLFIILPVTLIVTCVCLCVYVLLLLFSLI